MPSLLIAGNDEDKSVMPQMLLSHQYEPHIQQLFAHCITPTDIVLDIGANYGQHTVLLAKLAKYVLAIEASAENAKYCIETMELNKCDNYKIIQSGVWSQKQLLTFSHATTNAGCSYFSTHGWHQENERLSTIEVDTLDNLCPNQSFDFIKMDVEGSESYVLDGGKDIFTKNRKLLVELNSFTSKNFMNININAVIDKILNYGYNNQYIFSHNIWIPVEIQSLKRAFDDGAVLIDVYFTKD
jgi:FkbM family methyltransferase